MVCALSGATPQIGPAASRVVPMVFRVWSIPRAGLFRLDRLPEEYVQDVVSGDSHITIPVRLR